jgi:hypothetical protein
MPAFDIDDRLVMTAVRRAEDRSWRTPCRRILPSVMGMIGSLKRWRRGITDLPYGPLLARLQA